MATSWAPSVLVQSVTASRPCLGFKLPVGAPCFYLYYVGKSGYADGRNYIGVATSDRPDGGFADQGILSSTNNTQIGCGDSQGYSNIDPAPFVDADGSACLLYQTKRSSDVALHSLDRARASSIKRLRCWSSGAGKTRSLARRPCASNFCVGSGEVQAAARRKHPMPAEIEEQEVVAPGLVEEASISSSTSSVAASTSAWTSKPPIAPSPRTRASAWTSPTGALSRASPEST
jgi:hypothetical protein